MAYALACRAAATILVIHVFSVILLSQAPDAHTSADVPAAHDNADPTSSAPASMSAGPSAAPSATALPVAPQPQKGTIVGTATDVNNGIIPGATAVLEGPVRGNQRTVQANDNGFFEFTVLDPGTYHVTVSAKGFADWTSPAVVLHPGQAVILTGCKLKIAEVKTIYMWVTPRADCHRAGQNRRSSSAFSASSPISTSSMSPTPSRSRRS